MEKFLYKAWFSIKSFSSCQILIYFFSYRQISNQFFFVWSDFKTSFL